MNPEAPVMMRRGSAMAPRLYTARDWEHEDLGNADSVTVVGHSHPLEGACVTDRRAHQLENRLPGGAGEPAE